MGKQPNSSKKIRETKSSTAKKKEVEKRKTKSKENRALLQEKRIGHGYRKSLSPTKKG